MKQSKGQLMLCLAVAVLLLAASAPGSTAQDQNITGTFVGTPPATPAETAGATTAAEAPPLDTTAGGSTDTSAPGVDLAPVPPPTTAQPAAAEQPETTPATATPSPAPAATSSSTAAGTTNETSATNTTTAGQGSEQQGEAANMTTSRVDQAIEQSFIGVRSCLPFNILIAPAEGAAGSAGGMGNSSAGGIGNSSAGGIGNSSAGAIGNSSAGGSGSGSGRIVIEADYSVANCTIAAVEDGILTLSLACGFESQQSINFTVITPVGSDLRYVANYGSGLVVLAPGHNSSNIRLVATTVGQIQAPNLTAQSLTLVSSGVLGSSIAGSFSQASIITNVATGDVVLNSSTPVELTVQVSGITTVVADVPQGSSISGTAGGLSKVQYVQGNCRVTSQTPFLFPVPSIFGTRTGSAISGNKCEQVTTAGLRRLSAAAADPQWTCGIIVDGALSCRQGNTSQPITWNIQNVSSYQPSPNAAGDVVAPTDDMYDPTSGRVIPTGPPPGFNPDANTTAAASTNATAVPAGDTGTDSMTTGAPTPGSRSSDSQGTGGNTPSGGGRKLLQLFGSSPEPTTTQITNPPGSITTGSFTSGPGTFASGTGTVGGTSQTTTSQAGSPPQTTVTTGGVDSQLFNPIVVPATPPETFSTDTSTNATTTSQATSGTTAHAAATTAPAPAVSVSISTMGPTGTAAGVAVVNTMCSGEPGSMLRTLAELQQSTAATGPLLGPRDAETIAVAPSAAPILPTGALGNTSNTAASTTAAAGTDRGAADETQVVLPEVGGPGETSELSQNNTQVPGSNSAAARSP